MTRLLSDDEFALLRGHLRRTSGLEFDEARRGGLAAVVHDRLRASGGADVSAYLRLLEAPAGATEQQRLLDAVTIQETHFHRARPQVEALRHQILPDLLRRAADEHRELVVWSAGCSTGEEPYTVAMLLLETAERLGVPPRARVVGTDVSTAALEVARAATYTGRTVDLAERAAVDRWLRLEPDGTHVVAEPVRALVTFSHHNLVTDPVPFGAAQVDLLLCRHVTIYFSRETTREVVRGFRRVLAPSGWLLLGPTETLWQVSDAFRTIPVGDAFAYRPGASAATASPPPPRRAVPGAHRRSGPPAPVPARPAARLHRVPPPTAPRPAGPELVSALAAFDGGDYEGAAVLAEELVLPERNQPDAVQVAAYTLLGQVRLNRGDPAGAVPPLQRAVYLDPRAGHSHFLLAVALSGAGKPAAAAASYRAAAMTLPAVAAEQVRRILDGRRVEELVQLCRRLADDADGGTAPIRRGA